GRDVLATIARGPTRAVTDGSRSESSTLQRSSSIRAHSSEGSVTTSFVAPIADIAETASVVSYVPRETTDDMSVASLIPPSRAPSLRRTASMADLELEADIDRALGHTPAPASASDESGSNLLSPPRSRCLGFRWNQVTGREDTSYVPTDTEQFRGVGIVADSISFRGSSSARGDTHDALSTGYGSTDRSKGAVSSATYSRRRTLSGVFSSGSGLVLTNPGVPSANAHRQYLPLLRGANPSLPSPPMPTPSRMILHELALPLCGVRVCWSSAYL
ncbi:hypothetical protein FRC11_007388, partial [Ceratobasidium sp. 423]